MGVPKLLGYKSCLHLGALKKIRAPIILIRGLGRSSGFWLDFPKHLYESADVHMIDLLGTGRSPSLLGRGSIESYAEDVVHTLKVKSLLPCHLVGISLGGMICAEVARQLSDTCHSHTVDESNIASLTVIASSAGFTGEKRIGFDALSKMLYALRKQVPPHSEFAKFLVSKKFLDKAPHLPEVWDKLWKRERVGKISTLRQLISAARFNGRKTLKAVTQPTLLMTSKDDGLVSWANTPRLWEIIANAEMHVMEGFGHDLPTENPAEVARVMLDFYERVEKRLWKVTS